MKKGNIDNILSIKKNSIDIALEALALRVRRRRLEMNLTQKAFALRAGIHLPTYRRFETIGETSLRNLALIAQALNMTADLDLLFTKPTYRNLDDLLSADKNKSRKRGSINE